MTYNELAVIHFHDGSDEKISESRFSEDPKDVLREFLQIVRTKIH